MTNEEWSLFFIRCVLTIMQMNLTKEKMEEIENRATFKAWLLKVGFKWFWEYKQMCDDKNIPEVNQFDTIMRYLTTNNE